MSLDPPTPPDDPQPAATHEVHPLDFLRKQVRNLQNAFARKLGIDAADREGLVASMISRQEEDALSYWLQVFLAMGISTLGLVLNSTGVVIGAMLISPLMTPIVGLGMGLTTGSPFLTLRSLVRVGASVALVIASAAVLTRLLPFHEITPEIAGRTSPTLIDLGIASFCALAAGFTTVRHSSDTVAAAAGTAIGIALVPPLCVSGFGVGIASTKVAFGATLLFTANLCAILFFTVLLFFCIGYNLVDVPRLEAKNVKVGGRVAKLAAALRKTFGTRYGPLVRFALPLALVAAVFVPLSRALTEVAWKVRVRTEVAQIVDEVTASDYAMRSALTVEHGQVAIRLALVATPERAAQIETELSQRVAAVASSVPQVEVHAVPDFASLQRIADSVAAPVITAPDPGPDIDGLRERVEASLAKWPRGQDAILYWGLGFEGDTCVLEVTHVGSEGGDFLELLRDALQGGLDYPLVLRERAVELTTATAKDDDLEAFVPVLASAVNAARVPGISACVVAGPQTRTETLPPEPAPPEPPPAAEGEPTDDPVESATGGPDPEPEPEPEPPRTREVPIPGAASVAALIANPSRRVTVTAGPAWSVAVVRGECSG